MYNLFCDIWYPIKKKYVINFSKLSDVWQMYIYTMNRSMCYVLRTAWCFILQYTKEMKTNCYRLLCNLRLRKLNLYLGKFLLFSLVWTTRIKEFVPKPVLQILSEKITTICINQISNQFVIQTGSIQAWL